MQWPWCKKKEKEIVYLPIPFYGRYSELSRDNQYLKELINIGTHRVWVVEITETIAAIRNHADGATSPEELKAYTTALKEIKKLLALSEAAKRALDNMIAMEEYNKQE